MSKFQLFKYKRKKEQFIVDAYIAKYYAPDNTNILFESKNYLLENTKEIEQLIELLLKKGIAPWDLKYENTIINSNGIVLIDLDQYKKSNEYFDKYNGRKLSKKMFYYLIKDILQHYVYELTNSDKYFNKIDELMNFGNNSYDNIAYKLSKKLKNTKYPIDYIIR